MEENSAHSQELPSILRMFAEHNPHNPLSEFIVTWENVIYSVLVAGMIVYFFFLATRKTKRIPDRLQNFAEIIVGGIDDFVCGVIGPKGRKYTPFLGTLFMYILTMNLLGLIPFFKSPTANLSTTFALALCVFAYVQYTGIKEMGFVGYMDHLAGGLRGPLAFSIVLPLFMFILHIMTELFRPLSLALRLRGNIWGDEMLLGVLMHFGILAVPLILFNTLMAVLAAVIQAVVFTLLSTVYFALVIPAEGEGH